MDMEVMIPSPATDFNFDSVCTTPYISAPSSPQRFGTFFFSAPTSPTRATAFYNEFNDFRRGEADGGGYGTSTGSDYGSPSVVPFDWEEKPGIPKSKEEEDEKDFAFDFSGHLETGSLSAEELFHGGKIKPLKPPPRLQLLVDSSSPKSPRSPKKIIKEALSPRHRKQDFDPFAAAIEHTRRECTIEEKNPNDQQRGRERNYNSSTARQKGTRSLSPFRVSDLLLEPENTQENANIQSSSSSSLFSTSSFASFWYRKWKLKDLLLFRSASEGRARSKDQLKKYAMLKKTTLQDDVKNSSFRSTDSGSFGSVSSSNRRGPISAHELHYTANRAVSEEMKKKTFLPYKQGLLGCLGGIPVHEISKGIGSMSRTRN